MFSLSMDEIPHSGDSQSYIGKCKGTLEPTFLELFTLMLGDNYLRFF